MRSTSQAPCSERAHQCAPALRSTAGRSGRRRRSNDHGRAFCGAAAAAEPPGGRPSDSKTIAPLHSGGERERSCAQKYRNEDGGRCAGVKGSPLVIQYAAGYDGSSVGAVTEGRRSMRRHPLPSFFGHRQGRSGAAGAPITRALLAGEPPSQLCGVPPTVWRGPRCDRDAAASDRLGAQTAAAAPPPTTIAKPPYRKGHTLRRPAGASRPLNIPRDCFAPHVDTRPPSRATHLANLVHSHRCSSRGAALYGPTLFSRP